MNKKPAVAEQARPAKKPVRATPRATPAQQVRIIGGMWKRTPLPVLSAEGLRPTPDRVRETVFNWLTHLLDGDWKSVVCLDLFAGTGALGFEAASRGAAQVVMVEANAQVCRQLESTRDKLSAPQISIVRGDALSIVQGLVARAGASRFNLVFLDPPYHQAWLAKTLPLAVGLLADGGLVYAESEIPLDTGAGHDPVPEWMDGWEVVRADKAGMVFYHLLSRRNTA